MRPFNVFLMIAVIVGLLALVAWTEEKRRSIKICVWTGAIFFLLLVKAFLPDDIGPANWPDVADWIMPDGYFPHSVETTITVDENWIVGETKECKSYSLIPVAAHYLHEEPGRAVGFFHCGNDGPEHRVKATIYGRLNQPDNKTAYWDCIRESESFTCHQTGAERIK